MKQKELRLKPCPFCGADAKIVTTTYKDKDVVFICCSNVACEVRTMAEKKVETAQKKWNRRVTVD